jgi:N-methylhydantoinase B
MSMAISPITREIIASRLDYVTQEMGLSMVRTAHSVLFSEDKDFSCGIFDHTGNSLGLAQFVPQHQGSMQFSVQAIVRKWGLEEGVQPGDVFMHNDALMDGPHPPDITLVKPIFHDGILTAFGVSVAHHNDTGGMRPSSYCPDATEIYQEGIRFPAVKLFIGGELNRDMLDTYLTNVRGPETERGDLWAQLSTFPIAERGIQELCETYGGAEAFRAYATAIQDHAEARMRTVIRDRLAAGTYEAEDYQDHDGWDARSWKIKVTLTVQHEPEPKLVFDFTGTDAQAKGFVNNYIAETMAEVWAAVYCMTDPYAHKCAGATRPVEVFAPEGTIVNAKPPAPTGACTTETGAIVGNACLLALGQARPEGATGIWGGAFGVLFAWGKNPRAAKSARAAEDWLSLISDPGAVGGGARATKDGVGCVTMLPKGGPITVPNVEIIEMNFPLLYKYRRLIADGGGPGRFRGSPSYETMIQPEGPLEFTAMCGKAYHGASGIAGGKEGSLWKLEIRDPETDELIRELAPKVTMVPADSTQGIYMAMPGGGGYGDPRQREVEKVLDDVREGYVSEAGARDDYGVVNGSR